MDTSKSKKRKLDRYIDKEAAHSGDDTSCGSSDIANESEMDDSIIDDEIKYEEGFSKTSEKHPRECSDKEFSQIAKNLQKKAKTSGLSTLTPSKLSSAAEAILQAEEREKSDISEEETAANTLNLASKKSFSALFVSEDQQETKEKNIKEKPKPKLLSNKIISESSIPPKPQNFGKKNTFEKSEENGLNKKKNAYARKFYFRMMLTNGNIFLKFLQPVANAVQELRFNFTITPEFTGLRLEAHDPFLTLANKSRYECDIEAGEGVESTEELSGLSFCVQASSFLQTLNCATLPDTVLSITKYCDSPDKISCESVTNENDVKTVYACDLLAESTIECLQGMQFNLGYHVNIYLKTLKEQTQNAKKCGASTIFFALYQVEDKDDSSITHSKLSVGFKGQSTSGCHDFYQSAKRVEKEVNGDDDEDETKVVEWDPIPCLKSAQLQSLDMKRVSYNEYDNSKLRLFLNHMDIEWVLLHLCNDGTQRPLVMECEIGGKNTKHTIIVAPKTDSDANN
jgi:hypothetical protein